jgi:ubiquinone/menaquinone biosynthesis C-methylase UbiE
MVREPSEMSYLKIQAYVGTTKHMGGLETTRELIAHCGIDEGTYVLDVGCGAGATASYLASTYGCCVVGVDMMEEMVDLARARAQREGVGERVRFRVADARRLPFDDASFDVVLCESVATFVAEKEQLAGELARVVRAGGCVGLNEEVWLQAPPEEVVGFTRAYWGIEGSILTAEEWVALMSRASLEGCTGEALYVRTYRVDPRREASQVKRYHLGDFWRMLTRTLRLYFKSRDFRAYMRQEGRLPRRTFDYLGYVVLIGCKSAP